MKLLRVNNPDVFRKAQWECNLCHQIFNNYTSAKNHKNGYTDSRTKKYYPPVHPNQNVIITKI